MFIGSLVLSPSLLLTAFGVADPRSAACGSALSCSDWG